MKLAEQLRQETNTFHSTRVQRMVPDLYEKIVQMAQSYAKLGFDKLNFKNDDVRYSDVGKALEAKLKNEGFSVDIRDNFIHVSW